MRYIQFEQGEAFQLPFEEATRTHFKAFLQKMWYNKRWRNSFEKGNVPLSPFFKWEGNRLYPQNYVGFVRYQDCIIELYPKLFAHHTPSKTLMWKHLFFYLRYAQPKHFAWDFVQGTAEPLENAWEFYQMMCLTQIQDYLAEHLYQSYEPHTEALPFLRGKLDTTTHLKQVLSKGKWQKMAVSFASLTPDNPINQLLKYVLVQWQIQTPKESPLSLKLATLLDKLSTISLRHFSLQEALAVQLPLTAYAAQQVLDICLYFLENQIADLGRQAHQNFAWLLPMERIYEQFILGFLTCHFPQLKVEWQKSTHLALSSSAQQPALRVQPDMYLPAQAKVLDAKYKLQADPKAPVSILPTDAYQMIAYCLAKKCSKACLLYPSPFNVTTHLPQHLEIEQTHGTRLALSAYALAITHTSEEDNWEKLLTAQLIRQLVEIVH